MCTHFSCSGGGVDGDLALSIAIRVDNCIHVSSTLRRKKEEERGRGGRRRRREGEKGGGGGERERREEEERGREGRRRRRREAEEGGGGGERERREEEGEKRMEKKKIMRILHSLHDILMAYQASDDFISGRCKIPTRKRRIVIEPTLRLKSLHVCIYTSA